MSRNLHQYYYKHYFSELPERIIDPNDRQNRQTIEASLDWNNIKSVTNTRIIQKRNSCLTENGLFNAIENPVDTKYTFQLKITYPGLVTGIGINHEANIEGEFKLGVHFDWTYGMPVVYGSSVKGVMRNAFKEGYVDNNMIDKANSKLQGDAKIPEWVGDPKNKEAIIDDIFECKGKSIYNRDIFFDAVIASADSKGRILCSDSITPHLDGPLKNPIPITFMKIAPGCMIEFRFKLVDTIIDDKKFTKREKINLFQQILTTVGIGAKTNVGYGQLVEN